MAQLIITDFDGTLFPKTNGALKEEFIQKIKNLTDRGCLFSVNSGRPYCVLKDMLKPLINRTVFVCNDGAQIMYKNCLIFKDAICAKKAKKLYVLAKELGLSSFASLRERTLPVNDDILSRKLLFDEAIFKIVLVKNNSTTNTISKLKSLGETLGLRVCFEDNMYLEFCNATANKGVATAFLKNKFSITKDIYAFGDTEADLEMFKEADNCFIMAEATHLIYPNARTINSMQDFVSQNL